MLAPLMKHLIMKIPHQENIGSTGNAIAKDVLTMTAMDQTTWEPTFQISTDMDINNAAKW